MEFGANPTEARTAAADTCHWTNCTPQHARFNESAQLWQGLEKHILEQAVDKDRFRAQVITGPVFDPKDPSLAGLADAQYPLRFWKLVAAINAAGKLFATAYVLDQRGMIEQFGVRGAPAVPFSPYKTFQTTIAGVEALTGLSFTGSKGLKTVSLAEFDPLAHALRSRVARSGAPNAHAGATATVALGSLADVVLEA